MKHFPVYLDLSGRRVVIAGNGAVALAKLRLLAKTEAQLHVFASHPEAELSQEVADLSVRKPVTLHLRPAAAADIENAALVYAAHDDDAADAAVAQLARAARVPLNVVDNLEASDFITPAIVDRDPVVVAIGTEGAAPVLARAIKAEMEERLPQLLGTLARAGKLFRQAAEALPQGRRRRDFWADYYFSTGPMVLAEVGEEVLDHALRDLLDRHRTAPEKPGRVDLVGAGPGDPELMTLRARRLLDQADVVIHDRLVPGAILELARREATFVAVGKEGFGASTPQEVIHAEMIYHASKGAQVVRLKAGDPSVFARLDEETAALDAAGIDWGVVPGITAASAAAASVGRSLTRRGRNSDLRFLTAQDMEGFAEHDWRSLARPGAVAAVYMGKRAARFVQGRLLMHGAGGAMPVTFVENASRPDQRITLTSLERMAADLAEAAPTGPVILLLGLAPARGAVSERLPDSDLAEGIS